LAETACQLAARCVLFPEEEDRFQRNAVRPPPTGICIEPVSLVATQPFLVVAKKAMPADDLKGLIAWLKVNPGKASVGTAGMGAPGHVGVALFQTLTGTRFQFVPYRGGGPAVQDLIAGQLDIMFESPTNTPPQVHSGQLKAFAVPTDSATAPRNSASCGFFLLG
jgi:tripartite-type tricarboxylate transporter receptor subunit TctC